MSEIHIWIERNNVEILLETACWPWTIEIATRIQDGFTGKEQQEDYAEQEERFDQESWKAQEEPS